MHSVAYIRENSVTLAGNALIRCFPVIAQRSNFMHGNNRLSLNLTRSECCTYGQENNNKKNLEKDSKQTNKYTSVSWRVVITFTRHRVTCDYSHSQKAMPLVTHKLTAQCIALHRRNEVKAPAGLGGHHRHQCLGFSLEQKQPCLDYKESPQS